MSSFNTIHAAARCPVCANTAVFDVQFKYGDTWQYEYSIGDVIAWGGNDYGERRPSAYIEGISGPCPHCHSDFLPFVVVIRDDRLEEVLPGSEG